MKVLDMSIVYLFTVFPILSQIEAATDESTLRQVCEGGLNLIVESGFTKPVTSITITSKLEVMNALMMHFTLYRNKAVFDQLRSGLEVLGVSDAMRKYPDILEPFFVGGKRPPLTAGMSAVNQSS